MAQDTIIKGLDNPVVMNFSFTGDFASTGLSAFNEIKLVIGTEEYSTVTTPDELFLNGNFELRLKIGDSTALDAGGYLPEITGFSPDYDDGYLLSGTKRKILGAIKVL